MWAAAAMDGCRWYRMELPAAQLRRLGHEVAVNTDYVDQQRSDDEMTHGWHRSEVIVGQRVSKPNASKFWQALCASDEAPHCVYEMDDDFFSIPRTNPGYRYWSLSGIQQNVRDNLAAAHRVTVSTEPLAKVAREFSDNVYVVPNTIPAEMLEWSSPGFDFAPLMRDPKTGRASVGPTIIGWAGSATHEQDWAANAPQIARFMRKNEGKVDFHVIGADYASQWNIPGARFTPWASDVPAFLRGIDFQIGLAPLAHETFNLSKSPLKALEYGALGIPIVASNFGPYAEYVQDGVTGILVDPPSQAKPWDQQWVRALHDLVRDDWGRARMGRAAREQASELTIEEYGPVWESVLTNWE